ncbi:MULTISPECIES: tryptophan synthase subunit alpha [Cytobacillus]|uniref:Tryptophan synthase alpha chain n=1 Tax=Cytobacillus stercorigallinarum TaxID=2762240 RepID=A0ABR8QVP7_9BACI|nr:tryptophan synthase subunit alpha [Cytobacillus stercorigallinarum]MBD7939620.1 tryptophan synthase subunit alpha [Cytobacillus stercorigallinarum]
MNRIEKVFKTMKVEGRKAFVPYVMAGDGGLASLKEKLVFLQEAGATAIEIGIPFSDPVADGPVIQEAGIRALNTGVTLQEIVDCIREIRPIIHIPLIFMTYMNPLLAYGLERFSRDIQTSGIDGLIIPDLPIEEEEIITAYLDEVKIELIRLVTLQSPIERMEEITKRGKGFVYAVTVNGITGTRAQFATHLSSHLKKIKSVSPLPVLAGFGISTPEHVEEILKYCDGVIVGTKIIELMEAGNYEHIRALIDATKLPIA